MPGGQAYMVWINRSGKSRGTKLTWAKPGVCEFNERVPQRITLYKSKTGYYQTKQYELQVTIGTSKSR